MYSLKPIEVVPFNDKLYKIYRKIRKKDIKEGHIEDIRDGWHCDVVVRNKNKDEDYYFFLIELEDAEIVDDTPDPTPAATP